MDNKTLNERVQKEKRFQNNQPRKCPTYFKKSKMKPWIVKSWCIEKMDIVFRIKMYDILDLYEEPYNSEKPVVCVDEKSKQLIGDSRNPIPMKPEKPKKCDYEYKRNGTANIFVAVEPKAGKRTVKVTKRRTKQHFAKFIKYLVDKKYPKAKTLRMILDNLNTHFEDAFYETFDEKEAERILSKIEFHYTPTHSSWLNVAEIEIGVMDGQCIGKRIWNKEALTEKVRVWVKKRNKLKAKINWRFTKEKADEKLSEHYV